LGFHNVIDHNTNDRLGLIPSSNFVLKVNFKYYITSNTHTYSAIKTVIPSILLLTIFIGLSNAQIINVPGDQPSIQAGIDMASNEDTVLVAEGIYFENISFKGKAITVGSLFIIDGDTSHISRTIINGSRPVDVDHASTVQMTSGEDTTSVLSGLCITGGTGTVVETEGNYHRGGGGVLINKCGGKIEYTLIVCNHINYDLCVATGGGVYAEVGTEHNLIIRRNIIKNNTVHSQKEADAAGILVADGYRANIIVEYNRISNNSATSIVDNEAHGGGATLALTISSNSNFMVFRNVISYNELHTNPEKEIHWAYGAGINVFYYEPPDGLFDIVLHPTPIICDNIISNNFSEKRGGGISVYRVTTYYPDAPVCPQPLIINNTITDNYALDGSGLSNRDACPLLLNNTFRNDLSAEGSGELYNGNPVYNVSNLGIINANNNEIQGDWKNQRNIRYKDYPKVFSINHTWKVNVSDTGTISFSLLPPIWRRWWAYSAYALFILFLLLMYRTFILNQAKLRTALEVERIEREKVQEIEQMKSRFFANISHEFRTPLTLLLGPIEDLLKKEPGEETDYNLLYLMKRNALKLQRLINQILDLSRLETGKLTLQVAKGDLTDFVKRIVSSFLSLAESKSISYEYLLPEKSWPVFYDGDKIDKILSNLISNAFKFTPEKGLIEVKMNYLTTEGNDQPKNVELIVRDTGKGIPPDQIDHIFERFYRLDAFDTQDGEVEGTGIGLSLMKELVGLYRGDIHVESTPGQGSVFRVILPVAKEQFDENEIIADPEMESIEAKPLDKGEEPENIVEYEIKRNSISDKDRDIILVVEDNIDLRKYIVKNLSRSFRTVEAVNGKQGMEKAIDTIPDLIVSDLMMPEMDGMEMCEQLKTDERTSHIPVIILTAKADKDSKLEGLKTGADDYIIKPFDSEELDVRISNLIGQRRKLKEKYRMDFLASKEENPVPSYDDRLLQKLRDSMYAHLDDPGYKIRQMSDELGLSRTQLFRKVQALTGHSPNDLLNKLRLKKAAGMFRSGHNNIAQVMFEVGFNTPSYFARSFKDLYGSIPSEFIKNQ
jgi:signal transduction histidine kinase/DNA-binding response OmpR family regulator